MATVASFGVGPVFTETPIPERTALHPTRSALSGLKESAEEYAAPYWMDFVLSATGTVIVVGIVQS